MLAFAFWVATALFLTCSYPMSPPGTVPGVSSFMIANGLFLIATCCLVVFVFQRGSSCRRCGKKERLYKRLAYTWLCLIVLFGYVAVNDLVRRGAAYTNMAILVGYGIIAVVLMGVFFTLKHWQASSGRKEGKGNGSPQAPV